MTYTVLDGSVRVVNVAAGGGCLLIICGGSGEHSALTGVVRVRADGDCTSITKVTATVYQEGTPVGSVDGSTYGDIAAGTVVPIDLSGDYPGSDGPFALKDISATCGY